MKKPDSIDQMWKAFIVRVKLQTASEHQLYEMEMAFKAGCAALLIELKGPVAELSEEAGVRTMIRWQQEINDFLVKRVREYPGRFGQ